MGRVTHRVICGEEETNGLNGIPSGIRAWMPSVKVKVSGRAEPDSPKEVVKEAERLLRCAGIVVNQDTERSSVAHHPTPTGRGEVKVVRKVKEVS